MCKKLKWRTEPLPKKTVVLFQVEYPYNGITHVSNYLGYLNHHFDMMYADFDEPIGYGPDRVSRWIPYSEVLELIEE